MKCNNKNNNHSGFNEYEKARKKLWLWALQEFQRKNFRTTWILSSTFQDMAQIKAMDGGLISTSRQIIWLLYSGTINF